MKTKFTAMAMVAVMMLASVSVIISCDDSDAAFTVKDGEGTEFTFNGPVDHIMTIGVGATATAIGVGALGKIVVCDSYSKTNSSSVFDKLREYIEDGKIAANGNIYSSGKAQLETDIVDAAEPTKGKFDKEKDVVIAVVSPSYKVNLAFLDTYGFKNVLYWDSSVKTYDDIIAFVETISMVCNGKVDDNAKKMSLVADTISETLSNVNKAPKEAFYITYSSNAYKVGNTSSLTTIMIEAAGGKVVTKDDSKTASTIEVSLPMLKETYPDVIIFADSQIANSQEHMNYLRGIFGNDQTIVALDGIWNNFSIESATGVWTMACAMYPDLFSGDVPEAGGSTDTTMMYIIAGAVAVVIILAVAFFFMRSSGKASKRND